MQTKVTPDRARAILEHALAELKARDLPTFGKDVGERAMVFRLAHYMQCELADPELVIDCDYNRRRDQVKKFLPPKAETITIENGTLKKPKRFFPDIVLHKRRHGDQNILVCEVKRAAAPRGSDQDRKRLKLLTDPGNGYHYWLGALITIDQAKRSTVVEYFREGRRCFN